MDLVFLHGAAAAGKLTVGRALAGRLNYGLFHNHLVVDTLTSVFTFGSRPFVKLREQFWLATFEEAAAADASVIFTFIPEPSVRPGFPERARRTVENGGALRESNEAVEQPAADLFVDTERLAPEAAAEFIAHSLGLSRSPEHHRYPG